MSDPTTEVSNICSPIDSTGSAPLDSVVSGFHTRTHDSRITPRVSPGQHADKSKISEAPG